MSQTDFDPVLGRVTSGIYILTAGSGDRATGMLASWVMQAGFEPPMVSVAIKSGRYVGEWLTNGEPFVLNVVAEKQFDFLKHFGSGFEPGEPAFDGISITHCPRGIPILTDCLGHLQCEPVSHADSGDHRIFLARVVRGKLSSDSPPMTHVRKSGSHY
ncbi:MAG: flavin reductase family protein [Pirellulales bacterium]|nr:flavin reductase family protein [Pirellulales bacterium]